MLGAFRPFTLYRLAKFPEPCPSADNGVGRKREDRPTTGNGSVCARQTCSGGGSIRVCWGQEKSVRLRRGMRMWSALPAAAAGRGDPARRLAATTSPLRRLSSRRPSTAMFVCVGGAVGFLHLTAQQQNCANSPRATAVLAIAPIRLLLAVYVSIQRFLFRYAHVEMRVIFGCARGRNSFSRRNLVAFGHIIGVVICFLSCFRSFVLNFYSKNFEGLTRKAVFTILFPYFKYDKKCVQCNVRVPFIAMSF